MYPSIRMSRAQERMSPRFGKISLLIDLFQRKVHQTKEGAPNKGRCTKQRKVHQQRKVGRCTERTTAQYS